MPTIKKANIDKIDTLKKELYESKKIKKNQNRKSDTETNH